MSSCVIGNTTYMTDDTELASVLERSRTEEWRVRLTFGNPITGVAERKVCGFIGRTKSGAINITILYFRKKKPAGQTFWIRNILRVAHSNKAKGGELWRHPKYLELCSVDSAASCV